MTLPEKDFAVVFQGPAPEAHLAVGRLASEGIPARLLDENVASILPLSGMPTGFGSVKVVVAPRDEGRARKILAG